MKKEFKLELFYKVSKQRVVNNSLRCLKINNERPIKIIAYGIEKNSKEYFILRNSISFGCSDNIELL